MDLFKLLVWLKYWKLSVTEPCISPGSPDLKTPLLQSLRYIYGLKLILTKWRKKLNLLIKNDRS